MVIELWLQLIEWILANQSSGTVPPPLMREEASDILVMDGGMGRLLLSMGAYIVMIYIVMVLDGGMGRLLYVTQYSALRFAG